MLVEGAHRFGLAQLHQFRGRVGRSDQKSYCILVPGNPEEIENKRLQAMVKTNDGFKLAEKDLEIRGPGQFLGTRQSGYTELKLASITDIKLIEQARQTAMSLFKQDPDLKQDNHQELARAVKQFWSQQTTGDIS
jgi:ATP-dependent DNA helicase RecG